MSPLISMVNGNLMSTVSMQDRGLAYGDGLFETMRFENYQIIYKQFHIDRLVRGLQTLSIAIDLSKVTSHISDAIQVARDRLLPTGIVKLIVTRGESERGYRVSGSETANVFVTISLMPTIPQEYSSDGVDVYLCEHRLPINQSLAGLKHLNKLDYVMACLEWNNLSYQEALLLDSEDRVTEACSRNVFIVKDGIIFTPYLRFAGVAGVMRRVLMENDKEIFGCSIDETQLNYTDILNADEVFLTNGITGIWPVRKVMNHKISADFKYSRLAQEWVQKDWQSRLGRNDA